LRNETRQCLEKELVLKGYYLTEAETAGEFYVGSEHHTDGKSLLVISLTDEQCPWLKSAAGGCEMMRILAMSMVVFPCFLMVGKAITEKVSVIVF